MLSGLREAVRAINMFLSREQAEEEELLAPAHRKRKSYEVGGFSRLLVHVQDACGRSCGVCVPVVPFLSL